MPYHATTGFLAPGSVPQHQEPVSHTGQHPLLRDGGFYTASLLCATIRSLFLSPGSHSYVEETLVIKEHILHYIYS